MAGGEEFRARVFSHRAMRKRRSAAAPGIYRRDGCDSRPSGPSQQAVPARNT